MLASRLPDKQAILFHVQKPVTHLHLYEWTGPDLNFSIVKIKQGTALRFAPCLQVPRFESNYNQFSFFQNKFWFYRMYMEDHRVSLYGHVERKASQSVNPPFVDRHFSIR